MTGDTDDISALAEFGWYNWIWYHHPRSDGTLCKKRLGCHIGPSMSSGAAMCGTVFIWPMMRLGKFLDRYAMSNVIKIQIEETMSFRCYSEKGNPCALGPLAKCCLFDRL
jgi:hypothetical protein